MRYNYNLQFDRATPGMGEGSINFPRVKALVSVKNAVKEVWTLAIPASPTSSTVYTVRLNNGLGTARFTTDASATQAELQAGLLNAIRVNPAFGRRGIASVSGNNVLFTALEYGIENILVVTGASLTATVTTAMIIPLPVPFGRFVARANTETDPKVAGLPTATSDVILGITRIVKDIEMQPLIYQGANYGGTTYPYQDVMDVVDRTGESSGIWVECVETDITINDAVYVSIAAGHEGKATKVTSGTINISAKAEFKCSPVVTSTGAVCVLIGFNVP